MTTRIGNTLASTAALCLLAAAASAQVSTTEIPELESDRLVDEGLVEAKILDVDYDERMLTVRFDANHETARLIVPRNADIFRTFPNNLERRIELSDLRPGDDISVQAVVVEGIIHLHIIGLAS